MTTTAAQTKTPLTDDYLFSSDGGIDLPHEKKVVEFCRRLETDRARLMECLRKLQPLVAAYGLGSCPLMSEQTTILHASESARALLRELEADK